MPDSPRNPGSKVLVSACLLGQRCRYDAGDCDDAVLRRELADRGLDPVSFCPEEHGGLGTPRPAAWLTAPAAEVLAGDGALVTESGDDVTAAFRAGADGALALCQREGITRAFLKERSPSCGCRSTYLDGDLTDGPGLTTALLREHGIVCEGIEGRRALPLPDAQAKLGAPDPDGPSTREQP